MKRDWIRHNFEHYEKKFPDLSELYSDLKVKYIELKRYNSNLKNQIKELKKELQLALNKLAEEKESKLSTTTSKAKWSEGDEKL